MAQSEPTQLGKYKILAELGHGGFATVYHALDTTLEREVALKVLDPVLTRDPTFTARFQQEAKITAKLFHPNIAALWEVGSLEGRHFLAMQYIPGRNMRDLARENALLSLDQIVSVVQQIGSALDYAHARGAIHRDVKPSNIILDESGHATLTDFGVVKALEVTTIQTTSGAILGTPSYSSPEQAESKPLDGRSDLYSLGIVAYELCTGKVPFVADTTPSLYYKIVHEEPLPPSQINLRVAGPIEQVLLKAIAKQPDQRYPSGREFGAALAAAVEQVKGELAQSLYRQGRNLFTQDNLDEAEAKLRQAVAINPNDQNAQALLEQVCKRREARQRYAELADLVKQARAQAVELKQAHPGITDPDGVLRLLIEEPRPSPLSREPAGPSCFSWEEAGPKAGPSQLAQPFTYETPRNTSRMKTFGWILLVGAILVFLYGIGAASEYYSRSTGQCLIMLGLGGGVIGLVMLWRSGQKSP